MPKTTADPKPLYAVAGVADLAVAALRELTARLPVLVERAENAAVSARARLTDRFGELPAEVEDLRRRRGLPPRYFAVVGTPKAHKNLALLAPIAAQLPAPLVLLAGAGVPSLIQRFRRTTSARSIQV